MQKLFAVERHSVSNELALIETLCSLRSKKLAGDWLGRKMEYVRYVCCVRDVVVKQVVAKSTSYSL
jgi:hypothetical protein